MREIKAIRLQAPLVSADLTTSLSQVRLVPREIKVTRGASGLKVQERQVELGLGGKLGK